MAQHTHANSNDAIAMLTADHRQIRALFQQYEDTPDPYLKQIIAEHVFAELTLHTLLEETVFTRPLLSRPTRRGSGWSVMRCRIISSSGLS